MSLMVNGNAMLFGVMMRFGFPMLGRRRVGLLRVRVGRCRARTVRGNVAPANFGVTTGAIVAFLCQYHQAG
jgi:hypothetical protein